MAGRAKDLPLLRRCRGFTSVQALYVDTNSYQLPREEVIYCHKRVEKEILLQEEI